MGRDTPEDDLPVPNKGVSDNVGGWSSSFPDGGIIGEGVSSLICMGDDGAVIWGFDVCGCGVGELDVGHVSWSKT